MNLTDPSGEFVEELVGLAVVCPECVVAIGLVAVGVFVSTLLLERLILEKINQGCYNFAPPLTQMPTLTSPGTPFPVETQPPSYLTPGPGYMPVPHPGILITPVPPFTSPGTPFPPFVQPPSVIPTPPVPGSNILFASGTDPNLPAYQNGYGQAIDQVPPLDSLTFRAASEYMDNHPGVTVLPATPGGYRRYIFPDKSEVVLEPPLSNEVVRLPVRAYGPNGTNNPKDGPRINTGVRYDIYTGRLYFAQQWHNLPKIEKTK